MSEIYKPHTYQKKAIKFLLGNNAAGLLLDPGLGKTSITLAAIKILKQEKLLKRALIVAPLRVCYSVWPQEIAKWKDFQGLRIQVLHGKHKDTALLQSAEIYMINPEGLQWLLSTQAEFLSTIDSLIIDESTKFKNTNSQRFKILKPYLKNFRRRWILTGSPTPNGLLDLFGQIYLLDLGRALSPYITQYRQRYFDPTGYGGYDFKLKPGASENINAAIKPIVLRLEDKDYLELPEIIYNNVYVNLPDEVNNVYRDMERRLLSTLSGGESITAANAGVATSKCRQIANGGLYRTLGVDSPLVREDKWAQLHMEKAEACRDLVEELQGSPALIAYEFEQDLARLLKVFGKDTPFIGGGVSAKRGAEIAEQWNKGRLPVLLGQPASMAHGLNLQSAGNTIIWHSLTWNYEHYEQFIRRVRRQGSKHKQVFVHHILARDTIDEVILRVLQGKGKTQYNFLTMLKQYAGVKKKCLTK